MLLFLTLLIYVKPGQWQVEPFIKSTVVPVTDDYPEDRESLSVSVEALRKTLSEVQQLQIKIKVKEVTELVGCLLLPGSVSSAQLNIFSQLL
jgi:hypothetical protein